MVKRQSSSYLQRKKKDTGNKKAIIWVGSVLVCVIIILAVLIALNS